MRELPTGQQLEMRHGDLVAVATEVGGGLRAFTSGGAPVLDGFAADEPYEGGRGQTLLPWPNRVADGTYTWNGTSYQLGLTEVAARNAIHGLTRWVSWTVAAHEDARAELRYVLHPQSGWPFTLACTIAYSLGDDGLRVETAVTNVGREASPLATGAHPYLAAGAGLIDDCELEVPAARVVLTDDRGIPTGTQDIEGTAFDLRAGPTGDRKIDHCYTGITRAADGTATVTLRRPSGDTVALWMDEGYDHVQVYTGDKLGPERRRRGVAVEPMTAPPNALQTGDGLITLQPDETRTFVWGLRLSR